MTSRPELSGTFGAVTSTHWLASAVGFGVLERGGNAFDAAAAAGFTLQVVEPHLNGPAGEAPMILYEAGRRRTTVLCGVGPAPARASLAAFADLGLSLIPGSGLLPACVPAAFDSWMHLLAEYGSISVADALAPAIHYAETGFPMVPGIVASIRAVEDLFRQAWPTSAALWLPGDRLPQAGGLHRNPALAATYRRIVREAMAAGGSRSDQIARARQAWSDGFIAAAIDRFTATPVLDSSGRHHAGLLRGDDLAGWRTHEEDPVTLPYGDYLVAKCGPWSQGPVFLQQLSLLAGFPLADMDPLGADFIHTVVECAKLAFADREAYYGDPAFVDVPLDALLSAAHAASRRALVGSDASLEQQPSRLPGVTLVEPPPDADNAIAESGSIGEPTVRRDGVARGDTVHLDVCDRHGNMVSATPSGGWLPSSPTIPDLGFCLGTRGQMFWLTPGHPSALAPGKRPRSTLSPSFAFKHGAPYLAFGTPGGDQQDQWSLVMFLRHVHHGLNLQQAIEAPTFHSEHFRSSFFPRRARPGVAVLESRIPEPTRASLRERGHVIETAPELGRLSAVSSLAGLIKAAANPRGVQGYGVAR
jgi:gamma-glutamyltranspeptidase/glutathione hydrolase